MRHLSLLVVGFSLLLGGCGFQMRGDWQLPPSMKNTVVSGSNYQVLYDQLRAEFSAASANLTRRKGDIEGAHLFILKNRMDKRVLSVDVQGKVNEFEIYLITHFKLLDKDGKAIVPLQQINMTRDYPFAATDVLGAAQEEALLRKDLYRDMARQIMRRIQAQTK